MFVKVCGMTRAADVDLAVDHGATALGFVFWPASPRCVSPDDARALAARVPVAVDTVGVFVNEPVEGIRDTVLRSGIRTVQLHGDESVEYVAALDQPVVRALDVESALVTEWPMDVPILLDAADRTRRGGTGQRVNWEQAAALARRRRVVLAGGLTPDNVELAIETVRPYGVDVSSGVEDAPGIKNAEKLVLFLERARRAFERTAG